MKLLLIRGVDTGKSTPGELSIDGIHECFTLELARYFGGKENVHDRCCILPGTYPIAFYDSPHNKRKVPLLKNVPGRDEIEIHIANKPEDLLGCIGVGQIQGPAPDWIGAATAAFTLLMAKLAVAQKAGEAIEIEIRNPE